MRTIAKALWAASLALLLAGAVSAAEPATHEHGATVSSAMHLDHGHRWATDQPLRDGMTAMRTALATRLPAIHDGTLDTAGYAALADALEPSLLGIFAQCHLAPEADAQLHNVLLPAHEAIGRMRDAPGLAARREAAIAVIDAFGTYGHYFDHPGWQALAR